MITDKLKQIRLLLLDVDGVLTTGDIIYNDRGEETKVFNAKDGLGLRLLMKAGIRVGIVTGRRSEALRHRCKNLQIDLVFDGIREKAGTLSEIEKQSSVSSAHIAFVGDDLPDLPIMRKCGVAIAVADAHELVKEAADMVTHAKGGRGAVRETAEAILKAQDAWDRLIHSLF
ncbi:MAG: HAD-IIIA family hydrolase [Desulfobacteraceae bacterium]|nr:HAD-IIIA family hydrolase [Desulfobacteraceae bacterium]